MFILMFFLGLKIKICCPKLSTSNSRKTARSIRPFLPESPLSPVPTCPLPFPPLARSFRRFILALRPLTSVSHFLRPVPAYPRFTVSTPNRQVWFLACRGLDSWLLAQRRSLAPPDIRRLPTVRVGLVVPRAPSVPRLPLATCPPVFPACRCRVLPSTSWLSLRRNNTLVQRRRKQRIE
jgi:hypothetical protein